MHTLHHCTVFVFCGSCSSITHTVYSITACVCNPPPHTALHSSSLYLPSPSPPFLYPLLSPPSPSPPLHPPLPSPPLPFPHQVVSLLSSAIVLLTLLALGFLLKDLPLVRILWISLLTNNEYCCVPCLYVCPSVCAGCYCAGGIVDSF